MHDPDEVDDDHDPFCEAVKIMKLTFTCRTGPGAACVGGRGRSDVRKISRKSPGHLHKENIW